MVFFLMQVSTVVSDTLSNVVQNIESGVGNIVENTDNIEFLGVDIDIFNLLFAFLAFFVGVLAAVFDWKGFRASKRTADNVVRVTEDVQIAQFDDLIRHFYRNLICSLAISTRQISEKGHTGYVSESHMLKLKTLPEDIIHLDKYNTDKNLYSKMHEVKLLLRNYDTEVDVALMHFKDRTLNSSFLKDDFDNLLFKPMYFISRIVKLEKEVYPGNRFNIMSNPVAQAVFIIVSEHFNKLYENITKLPADKIHDLSEILDKTILAHLLRGNDKFVPMVEEMGGCDMSKILSEDNPYILDSTRQFILNGKFDCPSLNSFADGGYVKALKSGVFDFRWFLTCIISVDIEIEQKKIKFISFDND